MLKGLKLLTVFVALFLQGCTLWDYLQPPEREVVPPRGNRSEARELLHSFYQARITGESEEQLRAYLTEEAWNDYRGHARAHAQLILQSTNNRQLIGYRLKDESDLSEGRFAFTVFVQAAEIKNPVAAENVAEDIVVGYEEDEYQITSARFLKKYRLFARNGELVYVEPADNGEGNGRGQETVIFDIENLPREVTPLGAGPEIKFGVGRQGYSAVILSPENNGAAFGTKGTHGLIAVLRWKDEQPKEKNKNIELVPVDLVFEGTAQLLSFSPDVTYLAAEVIEATGNRRVRVYNTDKIERVADELINDFPPDKYSILFSRWEPNGETVLIRVNAAEDVTGAEEEKLGTWALNVKTGEREKVVE